MRKRSFLKAAGAAAATMAARPLVAGMMSGSRFPKGFLWGASTAAHQVEGNNLTSDMWVMENVKPTLFSEPSGDANNSFKLWRSDLDLVKSLGLNSYRFSLEWARIEPEPGLYSIAMLDHYKAMIEACRARGLTPLVTFNHFTVPRWFAARGNWYTPESVDHFVRYCERTARHLSADIGYATTLNEPNTVGDLLSEPIRKIVAGMNTAAGKTLGSDNFRSMPLSEADVAARQKHLLEAHRKGRVAIKSAKSDLPVGVSLAIYDDQSAGPGSIRDKKREEYYGAWLDVAKADDFLGVQNYARKVWGAEGALPIPAGAKLSGAGDEIYAPSLANAVRYAYKKAGVPVLVTEHGLCTEDDAQRAAFIPGALNELQKAVAEGVDVKGYMHWTLMDNFEWVWGYKRKYGLCEVDRTTFKRTPKPSAGVLGAIAKRNAV